MATLSSVEIDMPRALLVGLSVVTLVMVVVVMSTSTTAFGAYNPTWEGTSALRQEASAVGTDTIVATTSSDYARSDPESSVAVVLSPDSPYTSGETARLRTFVQSGGTLVVAEDFGAQTNPLLAGLGAQARVDGRPLRDGQQYYRSPALAVATEVTTTSLTAGVDQLMLNHGSVVQPNGSRVLVRSSPYAYLDENRNGTLDDDEQLTTYPVVTTEPLGDGRIVVVSDPSIFINAMLDRPDNRQFARTLLSNHETAVLDYSHVGKVPPLTAAKISIQRSPLLQALVGFAGIAGVAVILSRRD
jgi:hypothetical protein